MEFEGRDGKGGEDMSFINNHVAAFSGESKDEVSADGNATAGSAAYGIG